VAPSRHQTPSAPCAHGPAAGIPPRPGGDLGEELTVGGAFPGDLFEGILPGGDNFANPDSNGFGVWDLAKFRAPDVRRRKRAHRRAAVRSLQHGRVTAFRPQYSAKI